MTINDSIAFQELRSQLYAADYRPARAQAKRELRAIAVDGKALKGSARLDVKRRHLLSAATQGTMVTLAQAEVGAKTNETKHFRPLLNDTADADCVEARNTAVGFQVRDSKLGHDSPVLDLSAADFSGLLRVADRS